MSETHIEIDEGGRVMRNQTSGPLNVDDVREIQEALSKVDDEVCMVRYGRGNNGAPKNCLYTIRKGDVIYFGISRCNTRHDLFRKTKGRMIASERASLAVEEVSDQQVSDFVPHESGLRGVCSKDRVIEMLQYFDNIDEVILTELNDDL